LHTFELRGGLDAGHGQTVIAGSASAYDPKLVKVLRGNTKPLIPP
jgi:hypothetical protein